MPHAQNLPRGWHSRGYLPHFDGGEIPQSVTFRLADSFPKECFDAWRGELAHLPEKEASTERRKRIEEYLDRGAGKAWLRDSHIARLVQEALLYFDGERYRLHAWVVMPNHVHVLLTPCKGRSLSDILHSWKSYTTKKANLILGRSGDLWQEEYFDRSIRNERHFIAVVEYIESNPVKANLCVKKEDWKFGSAARRHAGGTPALPG
ncbi:MAG: REP-associated tyrosine transposase [Candidatus Binatia bacterium]